MTHYIATSGSYSYLPSFAEAYKRYDDAVEALAMTHDLGQRRRDRLALEGSIELDLERDGAEYAEINESEEEIDG